MAKTTFQGVVRSFGGVSKNSTTIPGVMTQSVVFAADPTATSSTAVRVGTSASTGKTLVLPAGAVPISVMTIGGAALATGGATIDIGGTTATGGIDDDGLFNEVNAQTQGTLKGADGALVLGAGLATNTTVYAKTGAVTASGGTFVGVITYAMTDDGSESN
jgi:hypothetical protein